MTTLVVVHARERERAVIFAESAARHSIVHSPRLWIPEILEPEKRTRSGGLKDFHMLVGSLMPKMINK